AAGRFGIMAGFRLYSRFLSLSGAYRLDLRALDTLRDGPPVILAPNHPSLIDALLILTRHPNLACVMKGALLHNIFLGPGAHLARYIRCDTPRQMIKEAVADLREGGTVLLFPEGTRTTRAPINPLTASVGVIQARAGSRADAHHRDRLALPEQGLAAVPPPSPAHYLPRAPGQALRSAHGRRRVHGRARAGVHAAALGRAAEQARRSASHCTGRRRSMTVPSRTH